MLGGLLAASVGAHLLRWRGARSQDGMLFLPHLGAKASQMFFSSAGKLSIAGVWKEASRCQLLGGLWDLAGCALGVDTPRKFPVPGTCLQPQQHVAHWLLARACGAQRGLPQGGSALESAFPGISGGAQVSDGWSTSLPQLTGCLEKIPGLAGCFEDWPGQARVQTVVNINHSSF